MFRSLLFRITILAGLAITLAASQEAFAQFRVQQGTGGFGGMTRSTGIGSSSTAGQRMYTTHGQVGMALIEADPDTRSIIVITDEETNQHISQIVKNLDRPMQQVLIKVVFLEVTYRDDFDFGVDGSVNLNNNSSNLNSFRTSFGLPAELRGGFYQLLEDEVEVTLHALAEVGKLEILSRPSILTRNNQEAAITVGQMVPFVRNTRVTDEGDTINDVEYEDIGITLQVTPFITQEGLVEMILAPGITALTEETVPISNTLESPVFAKRAADTVVVTPSGKTVVIGGMMEDNTIETVRKVPILGDIPLLGLAFKRTIKSFNKTELLIFLTPYVIEQPSRLIEMSKREANRSTISPEKVYGDGELDTLFDQIPMKPLQPVPSLKKDVAKSPLKNSSKSPKKPSKSTEEKSNSASDRYRNK